MMMHDKKARRFLVAMVMFVVSMMSFASLEGRERRSASIKLFVAAHDFDMSYLDYNDSEEVGESWLAKSESYDDDTCEFTGCDETNSNERLLPVMNSESRPFVDGCSFGFFSPEIEEFDFTTCCNNHDVCYSVCGTRKSRCDKELGKCMVDYCNENEYGNPDCFSALQFVSSLMQVGCQQFQDAQSRGCVCRPWDEGMYVGGPRHGEIADVSDIDAESVNDQERDANDDGADDSTSSNGKMMFGEELERMRLQSTSLQMWDLFYFSRLGKPRPPNPHEDDYSWVKEHHVESFEQLLKRGGNAENTGIEDLAHALAYTHTIFFDHTVDVGEGGYIYVYDNDMPDKDEEGIDEAIEDLEDL